MRWLLLLLLIPSAALADSWSGIPGIIDGDSISLDGRQLRLIDIDAFERDQECTRDGQPYRCGTEATFALISIFRDRPVTCEGSIRDRYHRPLVRCLVDGVDLGSAMVRSGWAVAEWHRTYKPDQEVARAERAGAWAGTFQRPKDWRKQHPR